MHTTDTVNTLLRATGINKSFEKGRVRALDNISLDIANGEILAVTGPSGSGKTTLLQILGTLRSPDSGEIIFEEQNYRSIKSLAGFRNRVLGFIFQVPLLIPVLTAVENIMLPLLGSELSLEEMQARAVDLLQMADSENLAVRRVKNLSAGERQRISLCRAFINSPRLVLADEPTGFLDKDNRMRIMDLMKSFNDRFGTTMVLATHDSELTDWAQRHLELSHGKFV
jgi:ABC-type lipoprotein export system ATPase subunit